MIETAIKAAKLAGEKLEYYFESSLEHYEKEDKSIVTRADLEADEIIINEIKTSFPNHQILSEEKGEVGSKSDYLWIIDPLDGTHNFARGIPIFCTSIALIYKRETIVSVVYYPPTNALFTAEKGKGAYWNGERIQVSDPSDLSKTLVSLGRGKEPKDKQAMLKIINSLYEKVRSIRLLMSASLELAYVAEGRIDAFAVLGLKSWDFIGGLLLVEEAGGKVTDFTGKKWNLDSSYVLASNGKIHDQLLETLDTD